eukprot:Seg974.11 transcript_id=Seg974.11/GoldUCD/mRNA.D3Y31 product="Major facilitator superfamily domain-containing protein 9" protein_id=Seg974.11/GoldUCD/D3Y31
MAANKKSISQAFLYVAGFLDLFAVALLIPLLAHEVRKYGASPTMVGLFMSIYGALQLISSPLMGQASDLFGRKKVLWFCLLGAGSGYLMLGFSRSLIFMFISRIPTGLLKHSQAIIKAYVADVTPQEERPAALGTLNAVCSSGFIIGPMIGGHIAMGQFGFQKVAFITGLLFILNSIFVLIAIPETKSDASPVGEASSSAKRESAPEKEESLRERREFMRESSQQADATNVEEKDEELCTIGEESSARKRTAKRTENSADDTGSSVSENEKLPGTTKHLKAAPSSHSLTEFVNAIRQVPWVDVADIFLVRFLASLAVIIFRSSFNLILEYRYSTSPKTNGYVMSYNAILGVTAGLSVAWIAKFFTTAEAMHRFFSSTLVIALLSLSLAPNITYVIIALMPLCFSTSVLRVTSSTLMYRKGGEAEKGLLTGLSDSFMSMARMTGPTIGGIAQEFSIYGPGIISTVLAVMGTTVAYICDIGKSNGVIKNKSI